MAFIPCFHALLRAQELISVRFGDLALPGDPRLNSLHLPARAGLLVRGAKIGRSQFVALSDESTLTRIQMWSHSKRLSPNDVLFPMSYFALSKEFDGALTALGL